MQVGTCVLLSLGDAPGSGTAESWGTPCSRRGTAPTAARGGRPLLRFHQQRLTVLRAPSPCWRCLSSPRLLETLPVLLVGGRWAVTVDCVSLVFLMATDAEPLSRRPVICSPLGQCVFRFFA